jgi:hypothetical protein
MEGLAWNGTRYVAISTGLAAISNDGLVWSATTNYSSIFTGATSSASLVYDGTKFVSSTIRRLGYSYDGITWSATTNQPTNLPDSSLFSYCNTITPTNTPTNTTTPTTTPTNTPTEPVVSPTTTSTPTTTPTNTGTPTSTPQTTSSPTPSVTTTQTSTPENTATPTNTSTPTITPSPSSSPSICTNTIYSYGNLRPNCSDYCTTNYNINTIDNSTQPYASLSIGDFVCGYEGDSGYLAYSNVSTNTSTGPFRIADIDGTGEVLGIYVCSGGSCVPL